MPWGTTTTSGQQSRKGSGGSGHSLSGAESQTNPVPLLVHTEAFNVGSTDARVVTVSATFWYENRQVCWNTIYLGTLKAGSHVARDSMVTCTLPSPFTIVDLSVGFTNLVVTP